MKALLRRQAPAITVLVASLVFILLMHHDNSNLNRAISVAVFGLLALSVGIGWGQVGVLSLAQAQFGAIGAYATAICVTRYHWSIEAAILPAVLLPTLAALVLGLLVVRLSPLALAIATLIVANLITLLITQGGKFTGGFLGLSGVPRVGFATERVWFAVFVWMCVVLVMFLCSNLLDSAMGRAMQTVRHDRLRAEADGLNVVRVQTFGFAFTGAIAGLAGWLYVQFISYIGPDSLSVSVAVTAVLMAVVGGARRVIGPIIGAIVLTVAGDYLPSENARGLFYGGTLVIILMLPPAGLVGMIGASRRRGGRVTNLMKHLTPATLRRGPAPTPEPGVER